MDRAGEIRDDVLLTFRIHVRDLNAGVSAKDLSDLFGKMCIVKEAYIPGPTITGFVRNFGIVKIQSDAATAKKCMTAFNGSLWKGSKNLLRAG
jgi:RNA recognition motif-containing protein